MAGKPNHLKINFVEYDSMEACLAAYFDCPFEDIPKKGHWDFMDAEGEEYHTPQEVAIDEILCLDVWGWAEKKKTVHFYVNKKARIEDIISVIAHEIGHIETPYYKSPKEEQKACKYARVAVAAWELATKIKAGR